MDLRHRIARAPGRPHLHTSKTAPYHERADPDHARSRVLGRGQGRRAGRDGLQEGAERRSTAAHLLPDVRRVQIRRRKYLRLWWDRGARRLWRRAGGLADYVVVSHDYIFPLPDNLSLDIGDTIARHFPYAIELIRSL